MRIPFGALAKKGAQFLLHVAGDEAQKAALAWLSQKVGGEAAAVIVHEATGVVARVSPLGQAVPVVQAPTQAPPASGVV